MSSEQYIEQLNNQDEMEVTCINCTKFTENIPAFYCKPCMVDMGMEIPSLSEAAPVQSGCSRCGMPSLVVWSSRNICNECSWANKVSWESHSVAFDEKKLNPCPLLNSPYYQVLGHTMLINACSPKEEEDMAIIEHNLGLAPRKRLSAMDFGLIIRESGFFSDYMVITSPIPVQCPHSTTREDWQKASMAVQDFFRGEYTIQSSTPMVDPLSYTFNCFLLPSPPRALPTSIVALIKLLYLTPAKEVNDWLRMHCKGVKDMRKLILHKHASPVGGNVYITAPMELHPTYVPEVLPILDVNEADFDSAEEGDDIVAPPSSLEGGINGIRAAMMETILCECDEWDDATYEIKIAAHRAACYYMQDIQGRHDFTLCG